MNDNEMLEAFVVAILAQTGMEHGSAQGAHNIVRFARFLVNETRKAQRNLDGEKFMVPAGKDVNTVYDN